MKICRIVAKLLHADGQINRHDEANNQMVMVPVRVQLPLTHLFVNLH